MPLVYPEPCDHKWFDSKGKCYKCELTRKQIETLEMYKQDTTMIMINPKEWEKELGDKEFNGYRTLISPIRDKSGNITGVKLTKIHVIKGWYYIKK